MTRTKEGHLITGIESTKHELLARLEASDPGYVRVGPILAIPQILEEFGVSADEAFALSGLNPELFAEADNRASFHTIGQLLGNCVQLTGCDHFGLIVGERFNMKHMGLIGDLMINSPSVGDALQSLIRTLHLHDGGAAPIIMNLDADCIFLGYSVYHYGTPAIEQVYGTSIAITHQILSILCGPKWRPLQVQFSHKQPRNQNPYRKLFRSPVSFDAEISGIAFDRSWMQQPIEGADPIRHSMLAEAAQEVDRRSFPFLKDRVRRVLRQMLLSGTFSAPSIARLFGVHARTLRRRLDNENTNLQQLVNETRFELARELLQNTTLPVADIASVLQYDDPNAFSRAFRSWADLSPNQWRKSMRSDQPCRASEKR